MIVRTALEDRTLQAELPGYLDFTKSALPARARNLVTAPVKQISACLGAIIPSPFRSSSGFSATKIYKYKEI